MINIQDKITINGQDYQENDILITLGNASPLPRRVSNIVARYLPQHYLSCIYDPTSEQFLLLNQIYNNNLNLKDLETLKKFINDDSQKYARRAEHILKRIYESDKTRVFASTFGWQFSMIPEMMGYAMTKVSGETVVELGGAMGENGILFAFAGAKKVIINDLSSEALESGDSLNRTIVPEPLRERIQLAPGDCLDPNFATREDLFHKVKLVLAQNLFHFFDPSQQRRAFHLLDHLLQTDGIAIITVNAKTGAMLRSTPEQIAFIHTSCELKSRGIPGPITILQHLEIYDDAIDRPLKIQTCCLFNKLPGEGGQMDSTVYDKFPSLQNLLRETMRQYQKSIDAIQVGGVYITQTVMRCYSIDNLCSLATKHGFAVEHAFAVNNLGHITPNEENAREVGIVIKRKI